MPENGSIEQRLRTLEMKLAEHLAACNERHIACLDKLEHIQQAANNATDLTSENLKETRQMKHCLDNHIAFHRAGNMTWRTVLNVVLAIVAVAGFAWGVIATFF